MAQVHLENMVRIKLFVSSVTPFRLKTEDNPDGAERTTSEATILKIEADRPAFLSEFGKKFYGVDKVRPTLSPALLEWNQMLCLMCSAKATVDCVRSFSETGFREYLKKIKIPVLFIHGDADDIVPIKVSGDNTAELIPHAEYIIYKDAPHGLFITEKDKLSTDLIEFITESK